MSLEAQFVKPLNSGSSMQSFQPDISQRSGDIYIFFKKLKSDSFIGQNTILLVRVASQP